MPIIKQSDWDKWVKQNNDPYGKACIDVTREVMRMLDEEIEPLVAGYHPQKNTPHSFICRADENIKAGGITGFMAGCVAKMISHCHSRGEEFKIAWNAQYDDKPRKGVINPAILTLKESED